MHRRVSWGLASKKCLKPLQSLYRRSLKLILLRSSSLETSHYKELNILPFHLRCHYNKGVFMFKIMNNLAPAYLCERFPVKDIRNKLMIVTPRPRTDLFKTSLIFSGSALWREIPLYIKNKNSVSSFKKAYHKYLIEQL